MITMKTSEVFKQALDRLWDGKHMEDGDLFPKGTERFCCLAVWGLTHSGTLAAPYEKILMDLLAPQATLEDWLVARGHMRREDNDLDLEFNTPLMQKVQATRKAWLEHLIEHYKSIGD